MASSAPQIDAVAELQNAFKVLFANWQLAIPTALVALLGGVIFVFMLAGVMATFMGAGVLGGMHPDAAGALLGVGGLTLVVALVVLVLLSLLASATVVGAAEHVWHGQPPDLAGGFSKAMTKLPQLLVLFLIWIVLSIICGLLTIVFFLGTILGILLAFFFMYTIPAIVVGNRSAMEALSESYRIVRANIGPSLMAALGIVVVVIVSQIVIAIFQHVPILNLVMSFIVGGLMSAYAALVTVRFYDLLQGTAPRPAVTTTPTL